MPLFDFSNNYIENHYSSPTGFSWSTITGVILGFTLAKVSELFVYLFKIVKVSRRFENELAMSEKSFHSQIKTIKNFKNRLSSNETTELEINLKQKFNTVKNLDKMLLMDFYWMKNLFTKKSRRKSKDYVTNTMGTIENTVAEMDRLEKYVDIFNKELIFYLKSYTEELEKIKVEHDKHLNNMTIEQWKAEPVLYFFGSLYVGMFHNEDNTMKPISMQLFEDALKNFHSKINKELPYVENHAFRSMVLDYNHRARMIINFFNHIRQQTLNNIDLAERSILMNYKEIFDKDLVV